MEAIAVLVLLALVAAGVVLFLRRRAAASPELPNPHAARRDDVRRLQPGDIVQYEMEDLIIRETYRLTEGGFSWQEHRADNGRWLSVEDDDELEVAWYETIDAPALTPGAPELTHDGATYRRKEHGRATFASERQDGERRSGTVEYYDYADGQRRLGFERYADDASWEVSVGRVINPHAELDIYPSTTT
jgi:hypothetical protein